MEAGVGPCGLESDWQVTCRCVAVNEPPFRAAPEPDINRSAWHDRARPDGLLAGAAFSGAGQDNAKRIVLLQRISGPLSGKRLFPGFSTGPVK